jgi:hypothetical protein
VLGQLADEGGNDMIWKAAGRWAILAIAIPVVAIGIRKLGEHLEAKGGNSRTTGLLRKSAEGLDWVSGRSSKREVAHH